MKLLAAASTAVLSLAVAAKAQTSTAYDGDLLIGFTVGTGNDVIYDLGAASSLVNGQTWNLNSLISVYDLTSVQWGVIGATNISGTKVTYTTTAVGLPPGALNRSGFNTVSNAVANMYQLFPATGAGHSLSISSTADESWNKQTATGSLPGDYHNAYGNPNVKGNTSDNFYQVGADLSAPKLLGSFKLATTGVVTFNVVSSAPPAPKLSATRVGNLNTISFPTTNGGAYSLIFTNLAGINAPRSNWFTLGSPLTGTGAPASFTDTTTDSNRIYSVKAH